MKRFTDAQIHAALARFPDWRLVPGSTLELKGKTLCLLGLMALDIWNGRIRPDGIGVLSTLQSHGYDPLFISGVVHGFEGLATTPPKIDEFRAGVEFGRRWRPQAEASYRGIAS